MNADILAIAKDLYATHPMQVWDNTKQDFVECPFEDIDEKTQEGILELAQTVIIMLIDREIETAKLAPYLVVKGDVVSKNEYIAQLQLKRMQYVGDHNTNGRVE